MIKSKKTIPEIVPSIISGTMVSLSFFSDKFTFLIFFSLVPLIYSIMLNFRLYKIFIYSFVTYIISFSWISNSTSKITDNHMIRIFLSVLMISGISLILSVFMTIPFFVLRLAGQSAIRTALIFPFIYIMGEWLQGIFHPFAFPWLRLGNILSGLTILIQPASLFGTLFISLFILFINMLTALSLIFIKTRKKYIFIFAEFFMIVSDILFGYYSINYDNSNKNTPLSVTIVQGNYRDKSKYDPVQTLDKYIDLSYSVNENKTDLILFPETSISSGLYENNDSKEKIYDLCENYKALLLFGSQYNSGGKHYNACIAAAPEKEVTVAYLKRILVPYGEYNPVKINSLKYLSSEFSPGSECNIINENIGCVICFESVFPDSVRSVVNNGAEVITVLSNDSWLGMKIPLYQHHSHSVMRAVENGRYVLTSANTGISSVTDNKGRVIARSRLNSEYVIHEKYCLNNKITLYTAYGDIIIIPSCLIILYLCVSFFCTKMSDSCKRKLKNT